jgi:hypothetical protein
MLRDCSTEEDEMRGLALAFAFEADLIAVEKNPIDNITTVQDPLLVISNGRVALDRLEFGRNTASTGISRRP